MASKRATKSTPKNKGRKADKEPTQEVEAPAADSKPASDKPDLKAKHKSDAIAKARAALKALGVDAPKAFDAIEAGTATDADYKALKGQADEFKTAVNQLGCHFQAKGKAAEG